MWSAPLYDREQVWSMTLLVFLSPYLCSSSYRLVLNYLVISSGLFSYLYDHERVWSMALDLPVVCSPWRLVAGAEILSLKILFCLVRARHLFIHSVRACEQKTIQFSKTRKHPPPPENGGGGEGPISEKNPRTKREKKTHKGSQFFFDGLYGLCPISFFFFFKGGYPKFARRCMGSSFIRCGLVRSLRML